MPACRSYVERREPDRTLDGARLVDWHARWTDADAASCGRRRPPGMPPVWNLDPRNPAFVGRDSLLDAVRLRLGSAPRAPVLALHGIGGVGKTQLAAEFAHRFAADYDLVW